MSKHISYIDIKDLVSCGSSITGVTVATLPTKKKCFTFKTFRNVGNDVIISKKEFEEFIGFVNLEKTEKPCD